VLKLQPNPTFKAKVAISVAGEQRLPVIEVEYRYLTRAGVQEYFENLRGKKGAQFLHVVTKKGYGYKLAEADPVKYHAASAKFNPVEGFPPSKPGKPTFTQVFGQWLCDMAAADDKLVAITPAMREGSGMVEFHKRFPRRYHDVGIAEQHAVTFAAGLACEGLKPVVAIYSTFLQRGYDQLIHDVALQKLPVVFALDRGGLVGADGPTHAGAYDFAYVRGIPNCARLTPSDETECRMALQLLDSATYGSRKTVIRTDYRSFDGF
jgi:1-deoxy-D-xylulose-5-phosphate synthase